MEPWKQKLQIQGYKDLEEAVRDYQRKLFGARYVGAALGKLEIPAWAAGIAVDFMKNPKNILLYHGVQGCGKTEFSASLIEWAFRTFNSFRVHAEYNLLMKLREGIAESQGDYVKHLEYLIDDDFVILDDVGSGINPERFTNKDLEWRREIFFNFLEMRYSSQKPTVITSNFSKEQFKEIYSDRICSRLFAKENHFIYLQGEENDKRMQGF